MEKVKTFKKIHSGYLPGKYRIGRQNW